MSVYCPKDGFEFDLPPTAPHGALLCCPQCLLPFRAQKADATTFEPFLTELNPDRLPLAERNGYDQTRERIVAQRLAQVEKKLIVQ